MGMPVPAAQLAVTAVDAGRKQQLSLFDIAPWSDDLRGIPNDYARSALFTVRNKKVPRALLQQETIYHVSKDVTMTYSGAELRADDDELVWMQVLEFAKRAKVGQPVSFTTYELCQELGWSHNGRYYEKALECLTRLQATSLQFSSRRLGRVEALQLIGRFRILDANDSRRRLCQVEIHPEILALFVGSHYSKVEWIKYRGLTPTARRLYDYIASHRDPNPLAIESFRMLCGSESSRPKRWREQVQKACTELQETGLVVSAWVVDDRICCDRSLPVSGDPEGTA